jgi:formylglycine-generating enzyme required for sulfatase activity
VIGISWFEATAFANWLTYHWQRLGWLPTDESIMLPNEMQWERAARGPNDDAWPWGDWTTERRRHGVIPANTREAGLLSTTAVGCFPATWPGGPRDMSGNVYEWTRTRWGLDLRPPNVGWPWSSSDSRDDQNGVHLRVIRGGSFFNASVLCRTTSRLGNFPDDWVDNHGFRLIRASDSNAILGQRAIDPPTLR